MLCIATTGGAGYCAGDTDPVSGPLNITNSNFIANNAQLGGSMYATAGCVAIIQGTTFTSNLAREYGGAIVTTDFVALTVQNSNFLYNGLQTGVHPPSGGGALSIGYNQFVVGTSWAQPFAYPLPLVFFLAISFLALIFNSLLYFLVRHESTRSTFTHISSWSIEPGRVTFGRNMLQNSTLPTRQD